GERGRRLYVGDESDGLLDVRFALVLRGRLEDAAQLLVAEIFLHDDSVQSVNVEDFGHGQQGFGEEARHVEEGVNLRVEGFGVDGCNGFASFPGDAEVFTRRGVWRERDNPSGVAAGARDVVRQSLARRRAKGMWRYLRRVTHSFRVPNKKETAK